MARATEPRDIAFLLDPIRDKFRVPGLAAAVIRDGKLEAIGAAGVRRAGRPEPLAIGDTFHIGSCTKAMTCVLAATLVEDGAIDWDSTVGQVLAEVADMHAGWRNITLEQLLTHRGGAPAELPAMAFTTRMGNTDQGRRGIVAHVLRQPPSNVGQFVYSNTGYVIAGRMLEVAAGASWEDLMRQRLFEPLGMTSAGFGAPGLPGEFSQPRGHTTAGQPVEPTAWADNPLAIGPAGTVHCSLADWLKFIALSIRGARAADNAADQHDLLGIQPETFRKLHTAKADKASYAFGWIVAKSRLAGVNVLAHDGSNTLWYASAWVSPVKNFAVVAVVNQGGDAAQAACSEAQQALIERELDASSRLGGR